MFEADDQSMLVWMMVHDPDTFQKHVYLESDYELHGDWVRYVPRWVVGHRVLRRREVLRRFMVPYNATTTSPWRVTTSCTEVWYHMC